MSRIAWRTRARISILSSLTNTIRAWPISAKINLTSRPSIRRRTQTLERIRIGLILTSTVVQTSRIIQITIVDAILTSRSIIANRAYTKPKVRPITARTALAWIAQTIIDQRIAVFARIASVASARIISSQSNLITNAEFAWRCQTRVDVSVAVGAGY